MSSLFSKQELKIKNKYGIEGVLDSRKQYDFKKLNIANRLLAIEKNPDGYRYSNGEAIYQLAYLCSNKGQVNYEDRKRYCPLEISNEARICFSQIKNLLPKTSLSAVLNSTDQRVQLALLSYDNELYNHIQHPTDTVTVVHKQKAKEIELKEMQELEQFLQSAQMKEITKAAEKGDIAKLATTKTIELLSPQERLLFESSKTKHIKTTVENELVKPQKTFHLDKLSDRDKLVALHENGENIEFISEPTVGMQMVAINQDIYNVTLINPPALAEEIAIKALTQEPELIAELTEPSEVMQITAVLLKPELISEIDEPAISVQRIAILKDVNLLKNIQQPSDEVIELAHKINNLALKEIEDLVNLEINSIKFKKTLDSKKTF